MIAGREVDRRLRWISEMRDILIDLRRSALEAYNAGQFPYRPSYDVRSDHDYWRKLAEQKCGSTYEFK